MTQTGLSGPGGPGQGDIDMELKESVADLVRDLKRYGRRYDTKRFQVDLGRLERALHGEPEPGASEPVRSPLATVLLFNAEVRRREADAARNGTPQR